MLIGIIGESCTGKSTLAEKGEYDALIVTVSPAAKGKLVFADSFVFAGIFILYDSVAKGATTLFLTPFKVVVSVSTAPTWMLKEPTISKQVKAIQKILFTRLLTTSFQKLIKRKCTF